jgi:hypothetical protein
MKLGVSINYWDCGELLLDTIRCIRPFADHLSIVFQLKSNYGQKMSINDLRVLNYVRDNKLVDEIIRAERPESDLRMGEKIIAGIHETRKRNIGLELARNQFCTHYMSMDADEFYKPSEFINIKKEMDKGKYEVILCQMQTYYKTPVYRIAPPEDYYVPVMYKITPELKFTAMPADEFPTKEQSFLVDPSRRCVVNSAFICDRNFAEMHHMSYVRQNIARKLSNSSAKLNYKPEQFNKCLDYYNNWQPHQKAMLIGTALYYHRVEVVPDFFNLLKINKDVN